MNIEIGKHVCLNIGDDDFVHRRNSFCQVLTRSFTEFVFGKPQRRFALMPYTQFEAFVEKGLLVRDMEIEASEWFKNDLKGDGEIWRFNTGRRRFVDADRLSRIWMASSAAQKKLFRKTILEAAIASEGNIVERIFEEIGNFKRTDPIKDAEPVYVITESELEALKEKFTLREGEEKALERSENAIT